MEPFEYAGPTTPRQAVEMLAERRGDSELLAGGCDLLALMKDRVRTPRRIVGLRGVSGLRDVTWDDEAGLALGAALTLTDVSEHGELTRRFPALAASVGHAAGPQIRNAGTLGGNLLQRPRCWYYRLGHGLLPRHDGRSMVRAGDNRHHAVLGNDGDALFVSPSTIVPMLAVLDARVRLLGPEGERELPILDLYRTPTAEGEREHAIGDDELLTHVLLPPPPAGLRVASYEVRQRQTLDWSQATAAVALRMDGDRGERVGAAKIVLGQVAPVPWPAPEAESVLAGKALAELTDDVLEAVGRAAVTGAQPLSQNRYKIRLAEVATRRAIQRAARGEVPGLGGMEGGAA
jgi:xanthine dehydrogenase YagS FAD-binding subunit